MSGADTSYLGNSLDQPARKPRSVRKPKAKRFSIGKGVVKEETSGSELKLERSFAPAFVRKTSFKPVDLANFSPDHSFARSIETAPVKHNPLFDGAVSPPLTAHGDEASRADLDTNDVFAAAPAEDNPVHLIDMGDIVVPDDPISKQGVLELREKANFGRKKWALRTCTLQGCILVLSVPETDDVEERIDLSTGCIAEAQSNGTELLLSTPSRQYTFRGNEADVKDWVLQLREGMKMKQRKVKMRVLQEVVIRKQPDQALGVSIAGGIDSPDPLKREIFIINVAPDGTAAAQNVLSKGDVLVEFGGHSLRNVSHAKAAELIRQASGDINVKVLRRVKSKKSQLLAPTTIETAGPVSSAPVPASEAPAQPVGPSEPAAESTNAEPDANIAVEPAAPAPEPVSEPEAPAPGPVPEPVAPAPESASETTEADAEQQRRERLKRMSEKRKQARRSQQADIEAALRLIDELPEE